MKLEPLRKKKKQDKQVESWGFSGGRCPHSVLKQIYFGTGVLGWSGMNPKAAVHSQALASGTSRFLGLKHSVTEGSTIFWGTRTQCFPAGASMQVVLLSDKPLAHVLFLKHRSSKSAWAFEWPHVNMCIQIKAIETQVPRPGNPEAKTLSLRAAFTDTVLGSSGQHPRLEPVWWSQPPWDCGSGQGHQTLFCSQRR